MYGNFIVNKSALLMISIRLSTSLKLISSWYLEDWC